jgi:hypothetical protein
MSSTTGYGHRHGRYCYWDLDRCGWVCLPDPSEATDPAPAASGESVPSPAPEPAGATAAGAPA